MRMLIALLVCFFATADAWADPKRWAYEWPDTDFSLTSIDFDEIISGGPPKDGIPSIDDPVFGLADEVKLADIEPVISLEIDGRLRIYPLRILIWHEIVNDELSSVPIAVTFCPLCNTALVFDRRLDGRTLSFGTTGKLRNSDLVMYDRETESWWQQFLGEAIVGELTGSSLKIIPARLEAYGLAKARSAEAQILLPVAGAFRDYGRNPYAGYDSSTKPFLYRGELPAEVPALSRVVRIGDRAWALGLIRENGRIEEGDLRITWTKGQASALDQPRIEEGRDVGNVIVERKEGQGWIDEVYSIDFAFAFKAFYPDSEIITE